MFSLININFLRNNGLFKGNLEQGKGNRMTKLGILFFVLHLNNGLFTNVPPQYSAIKYYFIPSL